MNKDHKIYIFQVILIQALFEAKFQNSMLLRISRIKNTIQKVPFSQKLSFLSSSGILIEKLTFECKDNLGKDLQV